MKKTLNIFFVTLGVIFLILLLLAAGAYIAMSFGLGTPFSGGGVMRGASESDNAGSQQSANPLISAEQARALQSMGIDPASLPSEITPEMEACFEEKLGKQRVDEIKGGSSPTATDFFKARSCI